MPHHAQVVKKMRNTRAENAYRAAWYQYCLTSDEKHKIQLEKFMDNLQPEIAAGPNDSRWKEFIQTLPGYIEFWEDWYRGTQKFAEYLDNLTALR